MFGCIQDVLARRNTLLVINRSCPAQLHRSNGPLLLHFPTTYGPITLFPCLVVCNNSLKSSRSMRLSVRDVAEIMSYYRIKIKLRSFKSSEHINEKGMGHTAVSATQASSVTL